MLREDKMKLLTPEETEALLQALTPVESDVLRQVRVEGDLCGYHFTDEEAKIASRLVRRGLVSSEKRCGCDRRHYYGACG